MLTTRKVLVLLFSLILICIAFEITAFRYFNNSQDLISRYYQHPLPVQQASIEVHQHLSKIRDILSSLPANPNKKEKWQVMLQVSQHEAEMVKQFDIIFDRFNGEKEYIDKAYNNFLSWYPLYGKPQSRVNASFTPEVSQNWQSMALVLSQIKATESDVFRFQQGVSQHTALIFDDLIDLKLSMNIIYSVKQLLILSILAMFILLVLVLKQVRKKRKRAEQLIDQHIKMATLTTQGNVLYASKALCRYLGVQKENVIGKNLNFFDNSDKKEETYKKITDITNAGKVWEGQLKRHNNLGEYQWFFSRLLPNFSREYAIKSYTNIIVDCTNNNLAMLDPLTEIGNKKSYEDKITETLLVADDLKIDTALAIIDIDNFKSYNDEVGHAKGDFVLETLANMLSQLIKGTRHDVFRLGGEKFALILESMDKEQSLNFFENIRITFNDKNIIYKSNKTTKHLSVSIGAAHKTSDRKLSKDDFYLEAERALKLAKIGRNAVCMAN